MVSPQTISQIPLWLALLLPIVVVTRWNGIGFFIGAVGCWLLVAWSNYLSRDVAVGDDAVVGAVFVGLWWVGGLPMSFVWAGIVWAVESLIALGWSKGASNSWRFSLRTLLIATTAVAVALGIIVWVAR